MVQISEYMNNRGCFYKELLPVYLKSANKIFAKTGAPAQYEHTPRTVWETSFARLSTESKTLLNLLTFFDPDLILESILSNKGAGIVILICSFCLMNSRKQHLCEMNIPLPLIVLGTP
ncbi:hypothetical protein MAP00_000358 [Monascus purpureus]|nr:hypothetical protein MAP00_000358 [Monascus purpureus]